MNRAREQLAAGIPADQAEEFRRHVRETLEQVEQVCRAERSTPRRLSQSSYQAYSFLKTLDLDHLPLREPNDGETTEPLQVRHLIRNCEWTQAELARIIHAEGRTTTPRDGDERQIRALLEQVQATAARVEELARDSHSHVARLPLRSRQAYEWLKFLSIPENLEMHLSALRTAYQALEGIERAPRAGGPRQFRLEFYNAEADWRVHRQGPHLHAVFNEGFVGAEAAVLRALVHFTCRARRKSYRQIVRAYTASDDFAEIVQAMAAPTAELDTNVQGRYYNLREVFARVNEAYFDGHLTVPRLTWNRSGTLRLMGHFQRASNTVMISMTLDSAEVPVWAIDHVMHHELLHRVLGAQVVDGRLYWHTPAFRAAERAFQDYARADAFLEELSKRLQSRTRHER